MPFSEKLMEVHKLMINFFINGANSPTNPIHPIEWPFLKKGLSLWTNIDEVKEVHLIGNMITWYSSIIGIIFYSAVWLCDRILLQREINSFSSTSRSWLNQSAGFLFMAWAFNYVFYLLIPGMQFQNLYYPAYTFSALLTACMIDFIARTRGYEQNSKLVVIQELQSYNAGPIYHFVLCAFAVSIGSIFFRYLNVTFGISFQDFEALNEGKQVFPWKYF